MSKGLMFVIEAVLLFPLALAFPCEQTFDPNYCKYIPSLELNETERDNLYSALLYSESEYPNHTFIEDYNLDINLTSPPNNTQIYNSKYIKEAWFSFSALFPSVYYNETLFVPTKTKALSHYNYRIIIPSNYQARSYPQNSQGDCKRTYELTRNESNINHFL